MRPSNAIIINSLINFLQIDIRLLPKITHLRLVHERFDQLSLTQWKQFFDRLDDCTSLYSLNISSSNFTATQIEKLLESLNAIQSHIILIARNTKTGSDKMVFFRLKSYKKCIPESKAQRKQLPEGWTLTEEWTEEELQELLLLGLSLIRQYPNIAKFSRKRQLEGMHLPMSILNANGFPHLLLKIKEMPQDIFKYNSYVEHNIVHKSKQKYILLALAFSSNANLDLTCLYTKIRDIAAQPRYKPLFRQEVTNRNLISSPARLIEREEKIYLLYVPGLGETLAQRLFKSRYNPSLQIDQRKQLRACISLIINVLSLHANGLLHRDIKPHNMIVQANDQVKLIDFGSSLSIEPGEQVESPNAYCTYEFAPPEAARHNTTFYYGEFTDAYSTGKCLQMILYPVGILQGGLSCFFAKPGTPMHATLQTNYMHGINHIYGKNTAAQILRLLEDDFKTRGTLQETLDYFTADNPELVEHVLQVCIAELHHKITDVLEDNLKLKQWLYGFLQKENLDSLFELGTNDFSSLLLLQIIHRYLYLLGPIAGFGCPKIIQNCSDDLQVLLKMHVLNIRTAHVFNANISKMLMQMLECRDCLLNKVIALRDKSLLEHNLKYEDALIAELGVLHNKIATLWQRSEVVPGILAFAINKLTKVSAMVPSDKPVLLKDVNALIEVMQEYASKLGATEGLDCISKPIKNLKFSVPRVISPVGVFYNRSELEISIAKIVNDIKDSAQLNRILSPSSLKINTSLLKQLLLKKASVCASFVNRLNLPKLMWSEDYNQLDSLFRVMLQNFSETQFNIPEQIEVLRACIREAVTSRCLPRLELLCAAASPKVMTLEFMNSMLNTAFELFGYDKELLMCLIKNGADPGCNLVTGRPKSPGYFGLWFRAENPYTKFSDVHYSLISVATEKRDFAFVAELAAYVKTKSDLGVHLVIAARHNSDIAVKALLDQGADPNELYPTGWYKSSNAAWFARYFKNENMQRVLGTIAMPKTSSIAWLCV